MTDQENNLVGCVNPGSTSKLCADLPSITSRFVTAVAKGEPHHWASLGGDAQQGPLATMFDGPRVDASYDPMRKQGAIVLGNGGDNSNGSQGTFYEGVMTAGLPDRRHRQCGTGQRRGRQIRRAAAPPGPGRGDGHSARTADLRAGFLAELHRDVHEHDRFACGGRQAEHFRAHKQWTSFVPGTTDTSMTFEDPVAPGETVSATFKVTSGPAPFNGDLVGNASWTNPGNGARQSETTTEKVRNVSPIKINEFRTGTSDNPTNSFIELYNAGASAVDISTGR